MMAPRNCKKKRIARDLHLVTSSEVQKRSVMGVIALAEAALVVEVALVEVP